MSIKFKKTVSARSLIRRAVLPKNLNWRGVSKSQALLIAEYNGIDTKIHQLKKDVVAKLKEFKRIKAPQSVLDNLVQRVYRDPVRYNLKISVVSVDDKKMPFPWEVIDVEEEEQQGDDENEDGDREEEVDKEIKKDQKEQPKKEETKKEETKKEVRKPEEMPPLENIPQMPTLIDEEDEDDDEEDEDFVPTNTVPDSPFTPNVVRHIQPKNNSPFFGRGKKVSAKKKEQPHVSAKQPLFDDEDECREEEPVFQKTYFKKIDKSSFSPLSSSSDEEMIRRHSSHHYKRKQSRTKLKLKKNKKKAKKNVKLIPKINKLSKRTANELEFLKERGEEIIEALEEIETEFNENAKHSLTAITKKERQLRSKEQKLTSREKKIEERENKVKEKERMISDKKRKTELDYQARILKLQEEQQKMKKFEFMTQSSYPGMNSFPTMQRQPQYGGRKMLYEGLNRIEYEQPMQPMQKNHQTGPMQPNHHAGPMQPNHQANHEQQKPHQPHMIKNNAPVHKNEHLMALIGDLLQLKEKCKPKTKRDERKDEDDDDEYIPPFKRRRMNELE